MNRRQGLPDNDFSQRSARPSLSLRKTCKAIQGFADSGELLQMLCSICVHKTEMCERSSLLGRQPRTARWKFEAVAQIVRLLDTIEAPGSPGHLSRSSDEGKVVEPTVRKHRKRTGIGDRQQKRSFRKSGKPLERRL